jgi:hypothetical protein
MIIHNPIFTGSLSLNGTNLSTSNLVTTGSNTFAGIQTVNSNLIVTGSITAATLVVQTITSSVDYVTGSTRFGSLAANTHVFTGSILVTGSLRVGSSNQQISGNERIWLGQNSAIGVDDANSLSLYIAHTPATGSPQIGFTYQFRQNDNSGANLYGDAIKVVKNAGANSTYTVFSTNSTIGAGTERMRIDANGGVSIGATSFTSPSGADTILGVYGGQDCSIILQDAVQLWELYVNDDFYINRGSTNVLTALRSNGNVGIGTSSPLNTLTLAGNSGYLTFLNPSADGVANTVIGRIASQTRNYGTNISTNSFASIEFATDPSTWYYGNIRFLTNRSDGTGNSGTERMRITSGGGVQIGSTSGPGAADIGVFIGGFSSSKLNLYAGYSGGAAGMNITDASNNTTVQFFGSTGNYSFAGSNVSDRRAKTNIQEITSGLPNLLQLKPSTFAYNNHPNNTKGGFIAQEVLEIIPEFVTIPEDETEMMGVDYNGILALAVKAIQELQAQINELKNN